MKKDVIWFKETIAPALKGYDIEYKYYKKGDFGSLNQVLFNSKKNGGEIDFWGMGWLSIHIWDYEKDEELLNVHLEPSQLMEQEQAIKEFQRIIDV